jgi:hypothetical protein
MMGRGGQAADSVSTAKWDGPKLTIVTKQEMGGQVAESTQVWTVADGGNHQRARHTEAGLQEVVVNEFIPQQRTQQVRHRETRDSFIGTPQGYRAQSEPWI